jgi:hypothetical protein
MNTTIVENAVAAPVFPSPRSTALFELMLVIEALDRREGYGAFNVEDGDDYGAAWGLVLADIARAVVLNYDDDDHRAIAPFEIRRAFNEAFAEDGA